MAAKVDAIGSAVNRGWPRLAYGFGGYRPAAAQTMPSQARQAARGSSCPKPGSEHQINPGFTAAQSS